MAFDDDVKTKLTRAVDIAMELFKLATGFDSYDRKRLAYFAVMTHYIQAFDPFPQLVVAGTPGTGKSATLNILKGLCGKVVSITGETITDAALRAAMKEAEFGTLIIEEADSASERDLENTLITRYSRSSASNTKMVSDGQSWHLEQQGTYGATAFHRRNLFRDPALLRRTIVLHTKRKKGEYVAVTPDTHPDLFKEFRGQFGFHVTWPTVTNQWDVSPAILDCFRPLVALAKLLDDEVFLYTLVREMLKASGLLVEEDEFLELQVILKTLLIIVVDKLKGKTPIGLISFEVNKIEPTMKQEFGASCTALRLTATQRNRIIRSDLGFIVKSSDSRNKVFVTLEQLITACENLGIEDDVLTRWKIALGMVPPEDTPASESEPASADLDEINREWRTEVE